MKRIHALLSELRSHIKSKIVAVSTAIAFIALLLSNVEGVFGSLTAIGDKFRQEPALSVTYTRLFGASQHEIFNAYVRGEDNLTTYSGDVQGIKFTADKLEYRDAVMTKSPAADAPS